MRGSNGCAVFLAAAGILLAATVAGAVIGLSWPLIALAYLGYGSWRLLQFCRRTRARHRESRRTASQFRIM